MQIRDLEAADAVYRYKSFSEAAYEFEPERGEKIFDARDFRVQTDGDLIIATLTDTLGSVTTYTGEINSAAYIMHIKKGGKAPDGLYETLVDDSHEEDEDYTHVIGTADDASVIAEVSDVQEKSVE